MNAKIIDHAMPQSAVASEFEVLCKEVQACDQCPRMHSSLRVLGLSSGRLDAPIMFIGEAPGRLGADSSAIPFHGDKAGHNFEDFLKQVGISRYDIFVTNAALCNPKDEEGNNATPTRDEIHNCSKFLARQIRLINPRLVVTLGATSLGALRNIEAHNLVLSQHVRSAHRWFGRVLIPLYHPGQRALVHRSRTNQLSDYHFVAENLKRLGKPARTNISVGDATAVDVVIALLTRKDSLSYFALHKLFYLIEYTALRTQGHRLTNSFIVRQKDGPYCVDLHPAKLKQFGVEARKRGPINKLFISLNASTQLSFLEERNDLHSADFAALIDSVLKKYGGMTDAELKHHCYMTSEMRSLLRQEKLGQNMLNSPLLAKPIAH